MSLNLMKADEFVTRCSKYLWRWEGYSIGIITDITIAGRLHESGF